MQYINMDFLTEEEKLSWLSAHLKIADLKIRICFRELEKHIKERIDTNLCFLSEIELKEYKESQAMLSTIKEKEETRRAKKNKRVLENTPQIITEQDAINGTFLIQREKKQFFKISIK